VNDYTIWEVSVFVDLGFEQHWHEVGRINQNRRLTDERMMADCERIIDRCSARHPGIYRIQKTVETEISVKDYKS